MSKLIRNTSDPASREFWENVEKCAAAFADAPAWMRAGIHLNPQHFHTYRAGERDTYVGDEASYAYRPVPCLSSFLGGYFHQESRR